MMTFDELAEMAADAQEKERRYQYCVRVCTAAGCISQHSDSIRTRSMK